MRRRRLVTRRDQQLMITVAVITLLMNLAVQGLYRWWSYGGWTIGTLDWVYVPGYPVASFVQAVENIDSTDPDSLKVRQVELSGPPEARGRKTVQELYDLLILDESYPDQIRVMRFLIEGPLTYYQFAEFSKIAPIEDITRRYLFSQVSVFKKK